MRRIRLISDFNLGVLSRYLQQNRWLHGFSVETTLYGQIYQQIMARDAAEPSADYALVWVRPEALLPSFAKAMDYEAIGHERVLAELDQYIAALKDFCARWYTVLHASFSLPPHYRGYGMLDHAPGLGLKHLLAKLNLTLADAMSGQGNFYLLDVERWLQSVGPRSAIPKMWYASKTPFSNALFEQATADIAAAIQGLTGHARKLVVVDLDDTLWGGVVGETGWRGIKLGGHDFVGEAFQDFQKRLKALSQRGVQLAIVSKNDEDTALEAIDHHPEMVLRRADFAGWRINWQDKAQNILDMTQELRLGLDSVVFIDDNPVERARVREAIGEHVLVPEWPHDPSEYPNALMALNCFDSPAISEEDRLRAKAYAAERERNQARQTVASVESWLASLGTQVLMERLNDANLPRAAQLLNKTNQMNMATRRLSQNELKAWAAAESRAFWTIRVSDRFGDSGLTGIISTELDGDTLYIVDFVMSCRVMGRQVEEAMLYVVVDYARPHGSIRRLVAELLPTERNRPCLDFWRRSGFTEEREHRFLWAAEKAYPKPAHIQLEVAGAR